MLAVLTRVFRKPVVQWAIVLGLALGITALGAVGVLQALAMRDV